MAHLYDQLASAIAKSAQDPAYRNKLLADANGTLKADGVDIGGANITIEWTDITNVLSVLVEMVAQTGMVLSFSPLRNNTALKMHMAQSSCVPTPSCQPFPHLEFVFANLPVSKSIGHCLVQVLNEKNPDESHRLSFCRWQQL